MRNPDPVFGINFLTLLFKIVFTKSYQFVKHRKMGGPTTYGTILTRIRTDSTLSEVNTETLPLLTSTTSTSTLVENFPGLVDASIDIDFDDEHADAQSKLSIAEKITSKVNSLYRAAHRKISKDSIYNQKLYCDTA
jgi:hypothetical protein